MHLPKIQYFIQIVESGSLSKAAERLFLSQPTLSRYLTKLEEEANVKLFIREKNNNLTLTECGRIYYEAARKMNNIWTELDDSLANYKINTERNTINIGVADDDVQPYISSCIDKLAEVCPETKFRVYHYNVEILHDKVEDGSIHIATSAFYTMRETIKYNIFRQSEVDLVVSNKNPLAKYSYQKPGQENCRISLKELPDNSEFAIIHEPTVLRLEENRYMRKMQYTPIIQTTYVEHETISSIMKHSNKLVGFCPRHLQSEDMAYIALDPPFFYNSAVYYLKRKELSVAETKMIALLKKQPYTRTI